MKKSLLPLLLALLCAALLSLPALAAERVEVRFFDEGARRYGPALSLGEVHILLDGEPLVSDVPGLLWQVNGDSRTMAPVRPLAEALGAEVLWLGQTHQVVLRRGEDTLVLTLGSARAEVNGTEVDLPGGVPAVLALAGGGERTMVPLRFVSEQLGARVDWDGANAAALVTSATAVPGVDRPFRVALDAGHGGSAPGTVNEGYAEKDVNLPITLRTAQLLEEEGCEVVLTRADDRDVDLYERCAIANRAEADIFVSIHSNALPGNPDFQGTFTYSYPGSVPGAKLARAIQSAVCAAAGSMDRGLCTENFVVLRETHMPAALLETGFMSNHQELMLLVDPAYQEKLARGTARGIMDYLNTLLPQ